MAAIYIALLAVLQLWVFSTPALGGYLAHTLERGVKQQSVLLAENPPRSGAQIYIAIMGSTQARNPRHTAWENLGHASTKRMLEGAALATVLPDAKIILGGGLDHTRMTKEALLEHGIDENRIIRNGHVTNTEEEIAYLAKSLREEGKADRELIIVSSATHIPRVRIWAEHHALSPLYSGADYIGYPFPSVHGVTHFFHLFIPQKGSSQISHLSLHEYAGAIYAQTRILLGQFSWSWEPSFDFEWFDGWIQSIFG